MGQIIIARSVLPAQLKSMSIILQRMKRQTHGIHGAERIGGCGGQEMRLEGVPMTLKEANAFVEQNHRHHGPVVGHKFSIGLSDGEKIVGVAIVGRPVARHLDDGWTLEVNRLCTDGTRNACSMLYAAAWRTAHAMGYKRLVTYILDTETGTSLKAAGWKCVGQAGGLRWTGKRRPEVDLYPAQMKIRWEMGGSE